MENLKWFIKETKKEKAQFQGIKFFFLLFSFLMGNLFGINLKYIFLNNFSLFIVPIILELINMSTSNILLKKTKNKKILKINRLLSILNSIKRGFLLGIFLEAFKVGS
jgi:hypothetical protein